MRVEDTVVVKDEGLILLGAGSSAIRFIPPLTIEEGELEEGLERFEKAVRGLKS